MNIQLSPYHEIFYNEWKLDPKSSKYNIVIDQTMESTLDISRLKNALIRFVSDHVLFNSHISEIENTPHWLPNLVIEPLTIFKTPLSKKHLFNYISQAFDLHKGPLYRFGILFDTKGNYRLVIVIHHLLVDGVVGTEFVSQVSKYYNSLVHNSPFSLTAQTSVLVSTTSLYEHQLQDNHKKYKDFWSLKLANSEPLDLSFLRPNFIQHKLQPVTQNNIKEIRFSFSENELAILSQITRRYGITTYMYSQCIFAMLLYRYTSQNKFAISFPIGIKGGISFICGARVNTIVIPYSFDENMSILDLFKQTKSFIKSLKQGDINYGHYPIDQILAETNTGLLDVLFAQTYLKDDAYSFADAKVIKVNHEFNIDLCAPLSFDQELRDTKLNFRVRYNNLDIDSLILKRFIKSYKKLFMDILSELEQSAELKSIGKYFIDGNSFICGKEYNNTLMLDRNLIYLQKKLLHQVFEEQVVKTPDNIALVFNNKCLTYQQLNIIANKFAHYLLSTQLICSGDLIPICLDKNENTLISILAILKVGAAYVPINPNCPIDRINFVLNDTKAKLVITNEKYLNNLFSSYDSPIKLIAIDSIHTQLKVHQCLDFNPMISPDSINLAYVIYTSGTTGKPKGVLQSHHNVIHLFDSSQNLFSFTSNDVWVLFHSYAFDFAVWEIFGALLYGGKLIIPLLEQTKDFNAFYNLCNNEGVTVLNQTPSAFYYFSEIATNKYYDFKLTKLRYVILGGEALVFANLSNWFACYGDSSPQIMNMYGITETTVHVTCQLVDMQQINAKSLIGAPMLGKKIYILDKLLNIAPIGAIGEMYIGGQGIASGYLNLPELTQEKFVDNPFQTKAEMVLCENGKLYRTGDLARLLPSGDLEYIGRNDHQVKVRGYRIELSEIEIVLNQYEGIKQSVVLVKGDNETDKYLIGYYVAVNKIDEQSIINYMAEWLPEYMVPNVLVYLDMLPLTLNGKLDQSALPVPQFSLDKYIVPNNERELTICKAYADVLNLSQQKIGINQDFFRLGGNSLLAVRLVTKLQHNLKITVDDIFRLRTPYKIAKIATFVKNNLQHKLTQVKAFYTKLNNCREKDILYAAKRRDAYLCEINKIAFKPELKNINSVLLAGASGHLGCNLLYQLLSTTYYIVYLPVRADSDQQAYKRLSEKFKFYFSLDIDHYRDRIKVFASDLGNDCLGLDKAKYEELISQVDSIIHAAASVRHYGDYDAFYYANVTTTVNLLNLCKLTKLKDFHYISTLSVLMGGYIPDCSYYTFSEYDNNSILKGQDNVYLLTKYLGETAVVDYRKHGVNSSIYRVGNLAMHSVSGRSQQNIEENAFFIRVKTILNLGILPKELSEVEISPVDCVASAVIKLFKQKSLKNEIHHIFNPNKADLLKMFNTYGGVNVKMVSLNVFISIIQKCLLHTNNSTRLVELFMLHQFWLQDINLDCITKVDILQDKTSSLLSKLGFIWPEISGNMLSDIITHSFGGVKQSA